MKLLLLVLTIITFGSAKDIPQVRPQLNSNAIIRQLFEMMRYFIRNGYVEKDIPIIDPYNYNHRTLEISLFQEIFSLQANFTNGAYIGLGSYQLEEVEFIKEEIAVDLVITFPSLCFKSEYYTMEGDIYEAVPLAGEGHFEIEMLNLTFGGRLYLKQSDDEQSILIHKISDPQFIIEKVTSRTEFDGNIDGVVNAIVNDLLASYLTRFNQYIAQTYVGHIIDLMNPFLDKLDSWRILATIL